ncbi:MAG TPA: glycoside hydrolase family 15 protein [Longimicrobiales bacterium]|nr:glycoside hydrolase family 15 protein [Longimicrobiales bacterium]
MRGTPYKPINGYGVIGDMRTAALVGLDGSIDWCCFPRFDSASVFGAILDDERGGRFRVRPTEPYTSEQRYLPLTNILVTTFHLHRRSGVVGVTDFMPAPGDRSIAAHHEIHRRIRCVRGDVKLEVTFEPRFDYGRRPTRVERCAQGLRATDGREELTLSSPPEMSWDVDEARGTARAVVLAGMAENLWLVLRYDGDKPPPLEALRCQERLEETALFWNGWSTSISYAGLYRADVERSALALKLLFYEPTGAVVAAPTTSLPEHIGGVRNWDYRYCWLRDAAFTLSAFHILGQHEEADRFMRYLAWMARKSGPALQIMYGIGGETELVEEELPHLSGYRDSAPVRIGNGAHHQLQLDIYGELLEAAWLWHGQRLIEDDFWQLLARIVDWVAENWRRPDCGIWEVRAEPRHYVHSKVMCWVALDRAVRMAEELGGDGRVERWRVERDAVHAEVMRRGWSEERRAFVQSYGTDALDAANLIIPIVGFLPGEHPRVKDTIAATLRELTRDGMLHRYTSDDGLPAGEGVFSICTFWLADALILSGDLAHGERVFRRMLRFANHLGLFSEELDPSSGDFLGNFPQAFTHIALINTAHLLERAHGGSEPAASAILTDP